MNQEMQSKVTDYIEENLKEVLSKMLNRQIEQVTYETEKLHGGTLGDVQLISGLATCEEKIESPYKVVFKTQKKWARFSDPNSWRREYDLYDSNLNHAFEASMRWPACYHKALHEDSISLWLEHIEGITGDDLSVDMYEKAAFELGRFQGKLYATQNQSLEAIENLSQKDFLKNTYFHYRSWPEVYDYIRAEECPLPSHLKNMLIGMDESSDKIWASIESLPLVLCHRDFWITNIFDTQDGIRLIDWDTTGWGHLGEDIASLIIDESKLEYMLECYKKCIPAYYKGFSEFHDLSYISNPCIYELILVAFGYRMVESFKFSEDEEDRKLAQDTLEQIYEMGQLKI